MHLSRLPWMRALLVTAAIPLCAGVALTQSPTFRGETAPSIRAVQRIERVELDGRLDEAAWEHAPIATGFVQRQPNPGNAATEETGARILYDDHAIYVGMRLYDSRPDSIAAQLARRDASGIYSDWAIVALDSHDDNRTAFVFGVNPRGVQQDNFISEDSRPDPSWDAVWEAKTRIDSLGWTAEFRIPLSQLRFSPERTVWGVQFQRVIARKDERVLWAPTPPDAPGIVSSFGALTGLTGLQPSRRLELQPYTVGRLTRAPGDRADPFYRENDLFGGIGADLKYGITSGLTLTATINPDFGQVEADPSVVNLTAYETFFEEKRPFFVEDADIFRLANFGEQLFYSRRIGRQPQGRVDGQFVDTPSATTILGAAKLSGKTSGGWSVGVLNAVTAPEEARYVDGQGLAQVASVEPLTNYSVARLTRDLRRGQSAVGAIFTATNRRLEEGGGLDFLRSAAYASGITGRHRFGGGDYEVSGGVLGSYVRGSKRAITLAQLAPGRYFQRPDAEHIELDPNRTTLSGTAADLRLGKIGGGGWRWSLGGHAVSPGFEVNDLGYQRGVDALSQTASIAYEQFEPGRLFRSWSITAEDMSRWNFAGERTATLALLTGRFQLQNYWSGILSLNRLFPALSVDALRGGPALRIPGGTESVFLLSSDPRKRVGLRFFGSAYGEDETNAAAFRLAPTFEFRPSTRSEFSLGINYHRNRESSQYVPVQSQDTRTHHAVARLEQTTLALATRFS